MDDREVVGSLPRQRVGHHSEKGEPMTTGMKLIILYLVCAMCVLLFFALNGGEGE